jgi:expansin (peptidoglycan-binding protein)
MGALERKRWWSGTLAGVLALVAASVMACGTSGSHPGGTAVHDAALAKAPKQGQAPAQAPRQAQARAPLVGRIRPGVSYHGVATAYVAGDGNGACLYGPAKNLMIAAMNYTDYESSKACGAYIRVHAANGASITVLVTNECPRPCAPGQLDLSHEAFAKLAPLSRGRIPITWSLLSPRMATTIALRYKVGSSRWWCGLQVIGHRNPVARLEVRTAHGWRQLPRTDYDYFISAHGDGCGQAIRVTDIYGQSLTFTGIALRPDRIQPTRLQFAQH